MLEELTRSSCHYTALFCEENIWHLAQRLLTQGARVQDLTVVFISNTSQQVAVFNQKTSRHHQPVIWDYHVILLHALQEDYLVYDFDSTADFPALASTYLDLSFPCFKKIRPEYQPLFRLIPATDYLHYFCSDRSHMKNVIAEPAFPALPPIMPADEASRIPLQHYWDFSLPLADGSRILTLDQLRQLTRY